MIPFWVVVLMVVRIVCTKRAIKRQNWLMTTMNKILQQELQYRTGTDLKQVSIIYILGLLPHYIIFICRMIQKVMPRPKKAFLQSLICPML